MGIRNILENLLREFHQPENRRVGHTTNALDFARQVRGHYVAGTREQAKDLGRGRDKIYALSDFERPFVGYRKPIILDNFAIQMLMDDAARELRKLEAENQEYFLNSQKTAAIILKQEEKIKELEGALAKLKFALTPSSETKYAYSGEFSWKRGIPDPEDPELGIVETLTVPWTTIKEIMKKILEKAQ